MAHHTLSHEALSSSSSTSSTWCARRLAWILGLAGGIVALLVGFALGRGTEAQLSAAPTKSASEGHAATKTVPVLVELFTSQGCSSCPPADRLLAELAREQPVPGALIVAMSEHVDYWNRLGWTDPFSSAQFSDRQRTYAHAVGSRRLYTPQMMVDGRFGFVGSERKEALGSIAKASMAPHADVTLGACDEAPNDESICRSVEIRNLPTITGGDSARVVYAVTESGLAVDVPTGENAGRELSHVAVVRELVDLGAVESDGTFGLDVTPHLDAEWQRENLRLVVFVQERASRRILGAGLVPVGNPP